ncbi:UDP-glucose/GDP-mannose dehydrogenase family protein [Pseudomonas sp. 21LCFQ010]|uniref:UDP-glucose dehydrogenase family protein n=1 Tax=Pseudomonas sp. 21LCFQ010 TaxID=2957506 RepID=UPI002097D4C0|nr:UDP-glucose/GDP-mannose dehydrogenase family protein [Pseudomonas sp. 21LCFQ010]MCO8163340.1 UDP-glucose/GDP-mannose dehydrogenase family protein [Pseudomonas sp. 21LCFQ010]
MKVTVFGTGYVGLTQAACLAKVGHTVCCVDVDEKRIEALRASICPIFEPGLEDLLRNGLDCQRLHFTTDAAEASRFAEVVFIAVGTPPQADGKADLSQVFAVLHSVLKHANGARIIINKSTSPVGTVDRLLAEIAASPRRDEGFEVISNPEFFKEGSAVSDCLRPDRIIVGGASQSALELMRELYQPFSRNREKFVVMDARSAELTKYAANCLLATKISFINEMANLAEQVDADIEQVRLGIGSDSRIGYDFIYPGCGFGGSCFPKDLRALIGTAEEHGVETSLLNAVEQVNRRQKHRLFEKVFTQYQGELTGKVFAVWGLSFKPETDDIREASSHVLLEALWAAGAQVQAHDPQAMQAIKHHYGERDDMKLVHCKEQALEGADALVVVTEWQDYRVLNLDQLGKALRDRVVFDGRNLFDPAQLREAGFEYYGIGRGQRIQP